MKTFGAVWFIKIQKMRKLKQNKCEKYIYTIYKHKDKQIIDQYRSSSH